MKPLEEGVRSSEARKQSSDDGPYQYKHSAKEKHDGRNVKRRKYFLDEEREYHVILWGATGFAGRFAAEYLAHYYMKQEDSSLFPFKSSAFPPVCPSAEGTAGSNKASANKPTSTSAPASGFLPSGLTPGEHEPGVIPPRRGTPFGGTKQSNFDDLSGPELLPRPDRVLGAEATILASESELPKNVSSISAVPALENGQTFAQGEGTRPEAITVTDAVKRCPGSSGARSSDQAYGKMNSLIFSTNDYSQCGGSNDSRSPSNEDRKSKPLTAHPCSTKSPHEGNNNERHNRTSSPILLDDGEGVEVRRSAHAQEREWKTEKATTGEVKNDNCARGGRDQPCRHNSASGVTGKHNSRSKTGQKAGEGGHGRGQGNDNKKSEREGTRFRRFRGGKKPESETGGVEGKGKAAEQGTRRENGDSKEQGGLPEDYHRRGEAAAHHEKDAGGESEDGEGNQNSTSKQNDVSGPRAHRKGGYRQADHQESEMDKEARRTLLRRLKACSSLSCDWALTPPSSSSVSASCLEEAPLNSTSAREKIKFALAGRSMAKLRHLRYQLAERLGRHCMRIDLIAVNPGDEEALEKLCSRGRVVLSTCGPYRLCGEPIVKACLSARTHYCDITAGLCEATVRAVAAASKCLGVVLQPICEILGVQDKSSIHATWPPVEVSYVADMASKYSAAAAAKNLKLLFFCGAGSLPSDLTVLMTQREALRLRGIPCHQIRTAVTDCFGGFSGGSVMGLGHIFDEGAVFDPFFLVKYASPSPPSKEELLPYVRPQLFLAKHDEDFGYCAYNVLAPLNENVVRLSAVLLGLYAPQNPQRDARSAQKTLRIAGTGDAVDVSAAQQGRKTETATFETSSPWRGASTSSPLFGVSPAVSPCYHGVSSAKAFSSSSKCTPARSQIPSSASNSPSLRPSPSFSFTTCPRRRNRSLSPSPTSPSSAKSVYCSPPLLPSARWRVSATSPLQTKPLQPGSDTAAFATATTAAAAATPAPPHIPSPASPAATPRRTGCLRAASATDTFTPLWTDSSFFHYSECVALGYDMLTASVVSLITFVLMFLVTSSFCRAALTALHIFPRPGEGPPRQFLDKGHFQIKTVGRVYPSDERKAPVCCVPPDDEEEAENEQERRFYKPPHCHDRETVITVTMGSASGDPGYKETGKMLVETGLAIALHIEDCFELCGVCTPASGVGLVLVDRLRKAGMKFEVKVKQF